MIRGLKVQNIQALKPAILVVDDEPFNVEIVSEMLEEEGYSITSARDGKQACKILSDDPQAFQAILLDRMMPVMNGIEVVHFIKADEQLRNVPVIMQSAKASKSDIQEGLDVGVLYYLTKPFNRTELLAIVDTAVSCYYSYQSLANEVGSDSSLIDCAAEYEYKSLEQARNLAILLSHLCPNPEKVVIGLSELLVNAVEHGNLGIGYALKSQLHEQGAWAREIDRRMQQIENRDKRVKVRVMCSADEIRFEITDQGAGFDSNRYLEIQPDRAVNTHGRGIAIARVVSFDELRFIPPGNSVHAGVKLNADPNKNSGKKPRC